MLLSLSLTFALSDSLSSLLENSGILSVSIYLRWAGHVARMGEERGVYRVSLGKPGGRRPMGRTRRRWVHNISMDLQEVGCGYMD